MISFILKDKNSVSPVMFFIVWDRNFLIYYITLEIENIGGVTDSEMYCKKHSGPFSFPPDSVKHLLKAH